MTDMISSLEAGLGVLSFAGIVIVLYGPWQWLWTDRYRMDLFAVRAKLFDLAASGRVSFDDPLYLSMRSSLNASIRFAHRATLLRVVWGLMATAIFKIPVGVPVLVQAVEGIVDPQLRADLDGIIAEARDALIRSMVARSPMLWLVVLVATLVIIVRRHTMDFGRLIRDASALTARPFRHMQTTAEVVVRPSRRHA
ncbi:hypothetical protein [Roseococcus sp. YIM B11640]|uniref:hypothetical protein n=1 Tax=Roseococcus sp. YIM B11640 TaxID=3133973 RepID=UPI003C7C14D6